MGRTGREADSECAAAIEFACNSNDTAVQFHQLLDQCQSDTRTLVTAATRAFDAMKTFEQVGQLQLGNPNARIPYFELNIPIRFSQCDSDLAIKCKLESIGKQV